MATICENEINELFELYCECDEQYKKLAKIMKAQNTCETKASASNWWNEFDRNELRRQFEHIQKKRCILFWEIQDYYMKKTREEKKKTSLLKSLKTALKKLGRRIATIYEVEPSSPMYVLNMSSSSESDSDR